MYKEVKNEKIQDQLCDKQNTRCPGKVHMLGGHCARDSTRVKVLDRTE